jgi:hypothetical protein
MQEITLEQDGKRFLLRTSTAVAGKLFQAVGVALPPNCGGVWVREREFLDLTRPPDRPRGAKNLDPCPHRIELTLLSHKVSNLGITAASVLNQRFV